MSKTGVKPHIRLRAAVVAHSMEAPGRRVATRIAPAPNRYGDADHYLGLELALDSPGYASLWGPDEWHSSGGGSGYVDLNRVELQWLRDEAIPAALVRFAELGR